MIVQDRATGGGTGIAIVKGDAIGQGVVSTGALKIGMSGEGNGMAMMSVHGHTRESDAGAEGAGLRTTSMRGDETEDARYRITRIMT